MILYLRFFHGTKVSTYDGHIGCWFFTRHRRRSLWRASSRASNPSCCRNYVCLYIESIIGKIHLVKLHDIMISLSEKSWRWLFDAFAELILKRFFEQPADNNVLSQYSITWSKSCNTGGGSSSSHLWETDNQIHFIITEKLTHVQK